MNLRYWPDPILSKICDPIRDSEFGPELEVFAKQMIEKMESYKGVGLAAPQVGHPIRMFVMHTFVMQGDNLVLPKIAVCNPTLEFRGDQISDREGCLSIPDIYDSVERAHTAVMRYFTPLGVETEVELHAMNARIVAHEADHLDGIMFFDRRRVSRQVNRLVERTWEKQRHKYFPKSA